MASFRVYMVSYACVRLDCLCFKSPPTNFLRGYFHVVRELVFVKEVQVLRCRDFLDIYFSTLIPMLLYYRLVIVVRLTRAASEGR